MIAISPQGRHLGTIPVRCLPDRIPVKIEGPIRNLHGDKITSFALTNVRQAYGLDLDYLKDTDGDGFPDVIDPAPFKRGYKDGEHLTRSV